MASLVLFATLALVIPVEFSRIAMTASSGMAGHRPLQPGMRRSLLLALLLAQDSLPPLSTSNTSSQTILNAPMQSSHGFGTHLTCAFQKKLQIRALRMTSGSFARETLRATTELAELSGRMRSSSIAWMQKCPPMHLLLALHRHLALPRLCLALPLCPAPPPRPGRWQAACPSGTVVYTTGVIKTTTWHGVQTRVTFALNHSAKL
mmetsp:Transcript_67963/g.119960  ORF Transcript_67963/g.119960 Transcript_67963/m.119960 type:complete len:205 (-) Transcript_67963:443-1057(-)